MERVRNSDRSMLIRMGLLVFALLAVVSFVLAGVPW